MRGGARGGGEGAGGAPHAAGTQLPAPRPPGMPVLPWDLPAERGRGGGGWTSGGRRVWASMLGRTLGVFPSPWHLLLLSCKMALGQCPKYSRRALQATGALRTADEKRGQIATKAGFYVFKHVLYYTPGYSSQDSSLEVNIRVSRRERSSSLRSSFRHEKLTFG